MKRFFALSLVGILACGGEAIVSPNGSGGAGSTAAATSGATSGATTGTGATSGSGGATTERCDGLEEEYAAAARRATACDPFIDVEQCTELVFTTLRCPCQQVFVNPGNAEALETLKSLTDDWAASTCGDDVACPDIACAEPTQGFCEPGGMNALGGTCQSQ